MGRKPHAEVELTAHQRAGSVALLLLQGSRLTTADIARVTQTTWAGAAYMMDRLTTVLPIDRDEGGAWFWVKIPP